MTRWRPHVLKMYRLAVCLALAAAPAAACSKNRSDVPAAATAAPAPGNDKKADGDTTPPPGVDMTKLDEFERKVFFRIVNKEASACGKAHSLNVSVRTDKSCRKSLYAARYVARLVDGGFTDSEIGDSIEKRFRRERQSVAVGDAPFKGNAAAPVTVVEFVDYECPHCKKVQAVFRQLLDDYKDEVKVVFKHYPLGSHTNARLAAEAATAAHKQGKFWAYSDKVWQHAESLSPALLEQIAKDVGLDVAKWRTDFDSEAVKAKVESDRSQGKTLGLDHTPMIYINGREYTDAREVDGLRDWINEELNR